MKERRGRGVAVAVGVIVLLSIVVLTIDGESDFKTEIQSKVAKQTSDWNLTWASNLGTTADQFASIEDETPVLAATKQAIDASSNAVEEETANQSASTAIKGATSVTSAPKEAIPSSSPVEEATANQSVSTVIKSGTPLASTTSQAIASGSPFEEAIREATSILYKNSADLDYWLAAPPPKIYVYDNLPANWTDIELISSCIDHKFLGYTLSNKPKNGWGDCFWEPRVCDETHGPRGNVKRRLFMNYRANYNNDIAYQKWFQNYEYRTTDPSEADFFVVPYPHWSHCICHKNLNVYTTRCSFGFEEMEEAIISRLVYYSEKKDRHLFLYGVDDNMLKPNVREKLATSMSISLGATCKNRTGRLCGHFVTPYLDGSSLYQPEALRSLTDAWWTSRYRNYSVGAAFSTVSNFHARVEFIKNRTAHLGEEVGGLPIKTIDLLDFRRQLAQDQLRGIYNSSVFCPILPGDNCPQKRFFDVIFNGCIPVVPSFRPSDEEGYPTFWVGKGKCSIRRTYPWSQGTFFGDTQAGINYQSLVVQFDGSCGIACMKPALEKVMANATELRRLRTNLKDFATMLVFGLDDNMYKRADAFTAMLVAIRHYVHHLGKTQNTTSTTRYR